jgi:hypothetical protein
MKLFLVLVLSLMALGTSNANAQNYNDGGRRGSVPVHVRLVDVRQRHGPGGSVRP